MIDTLRQRSLEDLRNARESLQSIHKHALTYQGIVLWYNQWHPYFQRADSLTGTPITVNVPHFLQGFQVETDVEVLSTLRERIVSLLNDVMRQLDSQHTVRPILDELILQIKDTKLIELLQEFNRIKDIAPNHAAMGFRTILTLIIQERAKIVNPSSPLATRDDLAVDPCINAAIQEHIFASGEEKLLKRYRDGGSKDKFDNVVHKPGKTALMNKDDLSDAVTNLLNSLLPTIVQ